MSPRREAIWSERYGIEVAYNDERRAEAVDWFKNADRATGIAEERTKEDENIAMDIDRDALRKYSQFWDYETNVYMRTGEIVASKYGHTAEDIIKVSNQLRETLNKFELKDDWWVNRGSSNMDEYLSYAAQLGKADLASGDVFEVKNSWSTSWKKGFGGATNFRIFAPKGTKGVLMGKMSKYPEEREVLLAPNQKRRFCE